MKTSRIQSITSYILISWILFIGMTIVPDFVKRIVLVENSFVILLFLFSIFLVTHYKNYKNLNKYSNDFLNFYLILILLFFIVELIDAFYVGFENTSRVFLFGITIIVIFGTIFLNKNFNDKEKLIRSLLHPYMHINLVIVTSGVLLVVLIQLNLVNFEEWEFINIYMKKAEQLGEGTLLYSMPFYLNLILSGANTFQLFGIEIIRLSGFSIEPQVSSLFTTPFLFFIGFYFKKAYIKKYAYLMTFFYLFFTASMTNFIGLFIILILLLLKNIKIILNVLVGILLLVVLSFVFSADNSTKSLTKKIGGVSSNAAKNRVVSEILNSDSLLGNGILAQKITMSRGLLNLSYFYSMYFIIIVFSLYSFYKFGGVERLLPIYLLIHSMKTQHHFWYAPFSVFFILLVAIFIGQSLNYHQKGRSQVNG